MRKCGGTLEALFKFTNGPATPGPIILRFEGGFGILAVDPDQELISFHSSNNGDASCGEPVTITQLADRQVIFNPAEENLLMDLINAKEHFVKIYDWTGTPNVFPCDYLTLPLLAEGTAQFELTDNDLFAFLEDHARHNAFGFTSQGILDLVEGGGKTNYNQVARGVWDPPDFATIKWVRKINLISDPR